MNRNGGSLLITIIKKLMKKNDNNILIYQDDNGITKVNVRFSDEDAELQEDRTYKDFLLVRQEGKRSVQRNIFGYDK